MGLLGQLGGLLGGNPGGGNLVGELFSLIQNHPGGLQGMLQSLQTNGLGDAVQSWVGTGANQPVDPDQMHNALGPAAISAIAAKLGISPELASSGVAQMLPSVIDKLTPNGQVPDHGSLMETGFSVLQGLLK
jgi:uncharacterized protein YidB (DUF937 family)